MAHSRFRIAVYAAVAGTLGFGAALAADDDYVRQIRNIAGGSTNQVTTAMYAAGVRLCSQRVDVVANFLTKGTQASALLFAPAQGADAYMVSMSAEVQAEGVPRAYASATFSPNTAIGCGAVYESVQYWNDSCNIVAAKAFKGGTPAGPLGSEINILNIGPSARVFLMRASSNSCVTIKKEVVR